MTVLTSTIQASVLSGFGHTAPYATHGLGLPKPENLRFQPISTIDRGHEGAYVQALPKGPKIHG